MTSSPHGRAEDGFAFESRLAKMARVLTGQYGINVTFSPDGPRVERDRIVVPEYAVTDEASKDLLTGYLDLLSARAKYSELDLLARLSPAVVRNVAQVIEDRRVCGRLIAQYPGARAFIARLRANAAQRTSARWHTLAWRDKFVWRVERALWDEAPAVKEHSPSLDVSVATARDMIDAALLARSTGESIRIAVELIARVRELSAGNVNNMMLSADADETLDAETVTGDDTAPADSASPADPSQAAAGMAQAPSDALAEPSEGDGNGLSATDANGRPLLSIPLTTQFDLITDLTGRGDASAWRNLRGLARAETAPLKAKLERALKADEQIHWKQEQERGGLDRRSLAKLATSPGYRTPFRTRRVTPGRNAAVSLLIDRSGSMAGKKIELARLCAAALCDALVQLDFDCEVLGYSSIEDVGMRAFYEERLASGMPMQRYNRFVERLDFQVYKRFGSNDLSGLAAIECGHENPDGEALAWAARRLADQRAERRILLVLSDGYPATGDGNPAVLRTDLRLRVEAIERAGIELIGVGILDDAVEAFYRSSVVVGRLHELPATALKVLGERLLQR
jgi:cobalamin biosynthesis protein CobT